MAIDDSARIDELEMKMAYAEQTIAQLNTTVTELNLELARTQAQLKLLLERLNSTGFSQGAGEQPDPEPPPPHY